MLCRSRFYASCNMRPIENFLTPAAKKKKQLHHHKLYCRYDELTSKMLNRCRHLAAPEGRLKSRWAKSPLMPHFVRQSDRIILFCTLSNSIVDNSIALEWWHRGHCYIQWSTLVRRIVRHIDNSEIKLFISTICNDIQMENLNVNNVNG